MLTNNPPIKNKPFFNVLVHIITLYYLTDAKIRIFLLTKSYKKQIVGLCRTNHVLNIQKTRLCEKYSVYVITRYVRLTINKRSKYQATVKHKTSAKHLIFSYKDSGQLYEFKKNISMFFLKYADILDRISCTCFKQIFLSQS